jgi:hypothetical protein
LRRLSGQLSAPSWLGDIPSPPSKTSRHRVQGSRDDEKIQPRREIFNVVKIVLEFSVDLLDIGDMPLVDLRPPGNARFHDVPVAVEGNF